MSRYQRRMESLGHGIAVRMGINYTPPWAAQAREAAIAREEQEDRRRATAGVGGTKTSEPSASPANTLAEVGGSKVSRSRSLQGWFRPVAREHFCFPPVAYPQPASSDDQPVGEGSYWQCRCGAQWEAHGQMVLGDHPMGVGRNDYTLGVERWFYLGGGRLGKEEYLRHQDSMYDFRPLGPYYVRLLRTLITAAGGDWRDAGD